MCLCTLGTSCEWESYFLKKKESGIQTQDFYTRPVPYVYYFSLFWIGYSSFSFLHIAFVTRSFSWNGFTCFSTIFFGYILTCCTPLYFFLHVTPLLTCFARSYYCAQLYSCYRVFEKRGVILLEAQRTVRGWAMPMKLNTQWKGCNVRTKYTAQKIVLFFSGPLYIFLLAFPCYHLSFVTPEVVLSKLGSPGTAIPCIHPIWKFNAPTWQAG